MSKAEGYRPDDARAPWNRARKARGRKDRRRWCRGKVGVEHRPVVELDKDGWRQRRGCYPRPAWAEGIPFWADKPWWCVHHLECAKCGKVLEQNVPREQCPVWRQEHPAA